MKFRSCVSPAGSFTYGIHKPAYRVSNMREGDYVLGLGSFVDGNSLDNRANFPAADLAIEDADWVYEIANPLPFRGTSYISKSWAERMATDPGRIRLPLPEAVSMSVAIKEDTGSGAITDEQLDNVFRRLPEPVMLALATCSTDPDDLERLAKISCEFDFDAGGSPVGLKYEKDGQGLVRPKIGNLHLFEALGNNINLSDAYRQVMVLRPGAQGRSEIVGEWPDKAGSHVFEYLRRNSYIPWGHFAANMANNEVRYAVSDLTMTDMAALRHLYYQRTYIRLAEELALALPGRRKNLSPAEIEDLRGNVVAAINERSAKDSVGLDATLWGWNYGFDFSPSGYRLHASHQQIHHQFAMVPAGLEKVGNADETARPYCCGDLVADFTREYQLAYESDFFSDYISAIRNNRRLDMETDRESSLIVFEDEHVMLFVPKAQTSQWELQLLTVGRVGNILEADTAVRASLDRAILLAMRVLGNLGARMVTVVEYSKRFSAGDNGQRLLYDFLPRLPESPGSMSEAQLRWIVGHFPEDFAIACRAQLLRDI